MKTINGFRDSGAINNEQLEEIKSIFQEVETARGPDWSDDEVSYLKDPPDRGPLTQIPVKNWVSECIDDLRFSPNRLKEILGINDEEVCIDIQENSLHILSGCNDPRSKGENWETKSSRLGLWNGSKWENRSMMNLISLGIKAGYRLFIILAGDKSSLRDQTQERVNKAFKLDNGVNPTTLIQSPTHHLDFKHVKKGYTQNFRVFDKFSRKQDWSTIIVTKKNTSHINELINQFKQLNHHLETERGLDAKIEFPR